MRKRLLQLASAGLVGLLLLAGLPWAALAQTETPTTLPSATPLAVTATSTRIVTATARPTNTARPTRTPVRATAVAPAAVTATPLATRTPTRTATAAPAVVTATPQVTPTVAPAELPITGSHSVQNTMIGLLPLVALLLLAIPAMRSAKARHR